MFAKYAEVRIAWLILFILSIVSAFAAVWVAYLKQDWQGLGLVLFFSVVTMVVSAAISEKKEKPIGYVSRNK